MPSERFHCSISNVLVSDGNDSVTGQVHMNIENLDDVLVSDENDSASNEDSTEERDGTLMDDSSSMYETAEGGSRSESTLDSDSDSSYSPNESFNSKSDSPPPPRPAVEVRRSNRKVVRPVMFTYDKIGTPVLRSKR